MPYIIPIFFLIPLTLYEIFYNEKRKWRLKLYFLLGLVLSLMAGLRYQVGRDWTNYEFFFENCQNNVYNDWDFELGFMYMNRFFNYLIGNFHIMQLCITTCCASVIYKHLFKYSKYPFFTLLLYILLLYYIRLDFTQFRQYIAIAICCCGIKFIEEKQIILWVAIIILAMQFHVTAIVAFPIYFTLNKRINQYTSILFLLFSIAIFFWGQSFVQGLVSSLLENSFIPDRLSSRLAVYFYSDTENTMAQTSSGIGVIFTYFFYALIMFLQKRNKEYYAKYELNFLFFVLFDACGRYFPLFSRVGYYYAICGCALCSFNVLVDACKTNQNFVYIIVCLMFIIFYIAKYYISWTSSFSFDYSNYQTFLF